MDDEREEELASIVAIYPELETSASNRFEASLDLAVKPSTPLLVRFVPAGSFRSEHSDNGDINGHTTMNGNGYAHIEHDVHITHLPPLHIHIILPEGYPETKPPAVRLTTPNDWLPATKKKELEDEAAKLWGEYGHCATLFSYIDSLQQSAEMGFDLDSTSDGCLVLSAELEQALVQFDAETKQREFDAGTYECGVCLEPKKGSSCYQLTNCGHVFCKTCLQDFYNNAINEGDLVTVRCLEPECGKGVKKGKKQLHPRELLAMGIDESIVRRYVEMKRKKKLEADKTTVYCPRTWCQGPARSAKYPPIPASLHDYPDTPDDSEDENDEVPARTDLANPRPAKFMRPDPDDRLAVCEKCQFAFCHTCFMSWHGAFVRCHPRDPGELSVEEQASYDYIRMNTSPCPTCSSPTQKTMGCNHMNCFQCGTHFCYLCGAWLDGNNPYQHFNSPRTGCYQRLWELEEGDEGQGPADGRGFAGARAMEALAIEAAQQAERDEREAAEGNVLEHDEIAGVAVEDEHFDPRRIVIQAMEHRPPGERRMFARRQHNPFPRHVPAVDQAVAVRLHERAGGARGRGRGRGGQVGGGPRRAAQANAPAARNDRPLPNAAQHEEDEIRRFIELAERDEEDGWNSDDLADADEDEAWRIR